MKARPWAAWLAGVRSIPWAMEPQALETLIRQVGAIAATAPPKSAAPGRRSASPNRYDNFDQSGTLYQKVGRCAYVEIQGTLMRNPPSWLSYFGVRTANTIELLAAVQAATEDDDVDTIALSIDSPGGEAHGVHELAEAILAAREEKDVVAVVSGYACSGAYWLASAADKIVATADSWVGCIGTYMVLVDSSKAAEEAGVKVHVVRSGPHKGAGEPGTEVTDEQLEGAQELIDDMTKLFVKGVAKGRKAGGLDKSKVEALATGKTWVARTAKTKGLVDEIGAAGSALNGLSDEDDDDTEDDTMAKKNAQHGLINPAATTAPAGAPAPSGEDLIKAERVRSSEIRAAFPSDPAFALEQIEAGSSLVEAKAAYAEVLQARLTEKDGELEKAKGELATAKAAPVVAPRASAPPAVAAKPEPAGSTAPGSEASDEPSMDGFMARARAYASERKCSMTRAMSELSKQDREGYREAVRSIDRVPRPDGGSVKAARRVSTPTSRAN